MYMIEDLFDKRSATGARLGDILLELGCTKAQLHKKTGISRPTIDKILAGMLTNKKWYEKHMMKIIDALGISPDILLRNYVYEGEYPLEKQLEDVEGLWNLVGKDDSISEFWGYVAILLKGSQTYQWFPVTEKTRIRVQYQINHNQVVIPAMNNRVLYLYMPNVMEIMFSEGCCDRLGGNNLNPDDSIIYYADGRESIVRLDFRNDTVSKQIELVYGYGIDKMEHNFLYYTDGKDGSEVFVNIRNVSMIDVPRGQVEDARVLLYWGMGS